MKAVRPVIALDGVLQARSVGSHSRSEKEEEGNNERKTEADVDIYLLIVYFLDTFISYCYFKIQIFHFLNLQSKTSH